MRNLVLIICLLLMCLLGWFYCQSAAECCGDTALAEEKTMAAPPAEVGMSERLMFNWSDSEPILGDDWDRYKADLVAGLQEDEMVEISGLYRSDETNNTSFENLGLARASKMKDLLSPPLTADRITVLSKLVSDGAAMDKLFTSVEYRKYRKTSSIDESIPDRTIIRFPFNSANRLDDGDAESYLDKLATRVLASGESIRLTGHTDNIGSDASNMALGQRRADIIRNYLIQKGVPAAKIQATSKGESAPVATNDTDAGRAENRRTELQIIK